jgi:hypothetical protein
MPPIIAPGVCEFTLIGTWIDRPWNTVLDIDINSDIAGDRDVNIEDQAQVLLNEWIDHVRPVCGANCVLTEVRWVDLDTASGVTGSRSDPTAPRVMPSAGTLTGDSLSGAACCLVKKNTASARGVRSGRIYMPGLVESQTNGNLIGSGSLAALVTAWDDFLAGVNQDHDGAFDYDSRLQVVHTTGGVFDSMSEVTSLSPQARLATQRRRLRA